MAGVFRSASIVPSGSGTLEFSIWPQIHAATMSKGGKAWRWQNKTPAQRSAWGRRHESFATAP